MCKTHHRALLYVVRPAADKRRSARTPGIHVHRRGFVAWFSDMLHVAPDVRLFRLEVCIGINSPLIRHDGFPL